MTIECGYVGEPDSAQRLWDDWQNGRFVTVIPPTRVYWTGTAWAVRPAPPKPRRYHPSSMAHRPN